MPQKGKKIQPAKQEDTTIPDTPSASELVKKTENNLDDMLKQVRKPMSDLDDMLKQAGKPMSDLDDMLKQVRKPENNLDDILKQVRKPLSDLDDILKQVRKTENEYVERLKPIDTGKVTGKKPSNYPTSNRTKRVEFWATPQVEEILESVSKTTSKADYINRAIAFYYSAVEKSTGLYHQKLHKFCFGFNEVEKTLEVAVQMRITPNGDYEECSVRLEALKNKNGKYVGRSFVERAIPAGSSGETLQVWTSLDLPWVNTDTADAALMQMLGFLKEKVMPESR